MLKLSTRCTVDGTERPSALTTSRPSHLLARIHVEAGVEEGAVAQRLVRVFLQDFAEVQLAAGCGILFVGPVALLARAMSAVLLHLSAWPGRAAQSESPNAAALPY